VVAAAERRDRVISWARVSVTQQHMCDRCINLARTRNEEDAAHYTAERGEKKNAAEQRHLCCIIQPRTRKRPLSPRTSTGAVAPC
jgi:hypothetical protein